jgi:hypothetical protein
MDVRMTNTAVLNFYDDVKRTGIPALKLEGCEASTRRLGSVTI